MVMTMISAKKKKTHTKFENNFSPWQLSISKILANLLTFIIIFVVFIIVSFYFEKEDFF